MSWNSGKVTIYSSYKVLNGLNSYSALSPAPGLIWTSLKAVLRRKILFLKFNTEITDLLCNAFCFLQLIKNVFKMVSNSWWLSVRVKCFFLQFFRRFQLVRLLKNVQELCRTPLYNMKGLNSSNVNWRPLSFTKTASKPYLQNKSLNILFVKDKVISRPQNLK